jgi:two-component system response regulator DcuR
MINVLIVDDDAMVAELNRCYLSQVSGFVCYDIVSTLQQAKTVIMEKGAAIDLVLLDVFMKQENGLNLLPILREFSAQTDVIIISSASDASNIQKALQYGVVDYLIKPFKFPRFEEALITYRHKKNLLNKQQQYAQSDVDMLLGRGAPPLNELKKLPKGLTVQTLRMISEWIANHQDSEFSTEALANAIGISRVSCRKYLIYLAGCEILATNIQYGATGRPVYQYHLQADQLLRLKQYCQ